MKMLCVEELMITYSSFRLEENRISSYLFKTNLAERTKINSFCLIFDLSGILFPTNPVFFAKAVSQFDLLLK